MSSPSPKSPELTDKSRKYDRQIRLWGEHGQTQLETAQVCLINATALGAEIMKGLVLPGIGGFMIVDDSTVVESDLDSNFFLDITSLGQTRAKCTAKFLQELNPDVNGDFIDESIDHILQVNPEFFKNFDVVVATSLDERTIVTLSNLLWDLNIPLVICRSVGFLGSIRVQIKEHCVVETHPDNRQSDLRLEQPFLSLKEHIDNTELSPKVPWLIVMYKYLQQYIRENNGQMPSTYKEKIKLREMIRSGMKADEENYEEAIKAVNSSFGGGHLTSGIKAIMNDESCINLNKQSTPFWILARAVKDFIETDGKGWLPLPGVIPDMTADTASYINLQNIYRAQALHDADIVYRRTQQLLKELDKPSDTITEKDVKLFCREAANLAVIRGTKVSDEYDKGYKANNIARGLETPNTLIEHYVILRAMEKFKSEYGNIPGESELETDTARIKGIACRLLNEWGINAQISDDLAYEICRYGGHEVHSISAYIGGCVAHELIKLITKQYKPINNTFIYNAITSQTEVYQL
uniref:NEDD8-activating enzyme E1 regulatory subunit n=1 Tax=Culicoides sonorensis TaxID=179676 RepID=A0A336LIK4_CULSO